MSTKTGSASSYLLEPSFRLQFCSDYLCLVTSCNFSRNTYHSHVIVELNTCLEHVLSRPCEGDRLRLLLMDERSFFKTNPD